MTHKWDEKLEEGLHYETVVREAFEKRGWEFVPSGYFGRLMHLDGHVLKGGTVLSVEIKADSRAVETGNAWVETISKKNQAGTTRGWAHTCGAQILSYYVPQSATLYNFNMGDIKRNI